MATWIALLRGVNVGGRSTLPMAELRELLADAGCADVRTYIQSGNAVFRAEEDDRGRLAERIAGSIEGARGFRPAVMLLTAEELGEAVAGNPFPEAEGAPTTLHLLFLASVPEDPDLAALEAAARGGERFALRGQVLYLLLPDGLGRSKLAAAAGPALAPVEATARNWRTVVKLAEMAGAAPG
jgi:uncharacterized protein (DUF1697 family)